MDEDEIDRLLAQLGLELPDVENSDDDLDTADEQDWWWE